MANNATDSLEEKILTGILDHANNPFSVTDTTLKLRLYSTTPSASDIEAGTEGTVITGGGYADIALTTTNMEVNTTSGVTKLRNKTEISFGEATDDYSAQVTAVGIIGNINGAGVVPLFMGALTTARTVSDGDTFKFAINALEVTLS